MKSAAGITKRLKHHPEVPPMFGPWFQAFQKQYFLPLLIKDATVAVCKCLRMLVLNYFPDSLQVAFQILLNVLFCLMNRVNPIREGDGEMEVEDISRLLHKHVTNMYPSIKEAFLAFDQVKLGF